MMLSKVTRFSKQLSGDWGKFSIVAARSYSDFEYRSQSKEKYVTAFYNQSAIDVAAAKVSISIY